MDQFSGSRPASIDIAANLPRFGEKRATLTVTIFDDTERAVTVPITLRGIEPKPPYVEELPDSLELRPTANESAVRREFEVVTIEEDADEIWMTGFDSTSPLISTAIVDSQKIHNRGQAVSRRYKVVMTANAPVGDEEPLRAWLSVVGRLPSTTKTERIAVKVERKAALRASPSRIFLSPSEIGDGVVERNVVLTHDFAENPEFEITSNDNDWLSAVAVPTPNRQLCTLKVRIQLHDLTAVQEPLLKSELVIQIKGISGVGLVRLPVIVQLRSI